MANTSDIRKNINLLTEGQIVSEDDMMAMPQDGNVTKVEVEFKGPNEVEVEVKANGVEELKRLMDLAGVFHQEKTVTANAMMQPQVSSVPSVDMPTDQNVSVEPQMDMEPETGDQVDLFSEPTDLNVDNVDMSDDMPELDFSTGDDLDYDDAGLEETEMSIEESDAALSDGRFDYGHPNPLRGQEPYKLDVSQNSGMATRPMRNIPGGTGDNKMLDKTKPEARKGLREYIEEIEELKNPELAQEIVNKTADTLKLDPASKMKAIKAAQDATKNTADYNKMTAGDVVNNTIQNNRQVTLRPDQQEALKKAVPALDKEFVEAEMDEARDSFKYSFKQSVLPFQGLTGAQKVRRNALRAARKGFK